MALLRIGAVAAAIVACILMPSPALGASACATAVLRDWSDDGQVAPNYSPPCYEEAIDALPPDLRDYTDAEDVITRALSSAVRTGKSPPPPTRGSAAAVPVPLIAIVAVSLMVLAAGALGHLSRRRYVRRTGQPAHRR